MLKVNNGRLGICDIFSCVFLDIIIDIFHETLTTGNKEWNNTIDNMLWKLQTGWHRNFYKRHCLHFHIIQSFIWNLTLCSKQFSSSFYFIFQKFHQDTWNTFVYPKKLKESCPLPFKPVCFLLLAICRATKSLAKSKPNCWAPLGWSCAWGRRLFQSFFLLVPIVYAKEAVDHLLDLDLAVYEPMRWSTMSVQPFVKS